MFPQILFVHSDLDFSRNNVSAVIDEHCQTFHQDIIHIESRCKAKFNERMLAMKYRRKPNRNYTNELNKHFILHYSEKKSF